MMSEADREQYGSIKESNAEQPTKESCSSGENGSCSSGENGSCSSGENGLMDEILCTNEPGPINPSSPSFGQSVCLPDENEDSTRKGKNSDDELIMISYSRKSAKKMCKDIYTELKGRGYNVWIDQNDVSGNILEAVAKGIENSSIVLLGISEEYYNSYWCKAEAEYAFQCRKVFIPMKMESNYKPESWLGFIIGLRTHVDFTKPDFNKAITSLVREIETVRKSLNKDPVNVLTNNQPIVTMKQSSTLPQNVLEWNNDSVLDWLKREELEVFQKALGPINGKALLELYKMKLSSPADYYRNIEALLSSENPLRLCHNLRFSAALESLFTPSNNIFMTDWFRIIILLLPLAASVGIINYSWM